MKKISLLVLAASLFPVAASAHEHQLFEIGGNAYEITVGSLNEPIAVDDKTGAYISVKEAGTPSHNDGETHEETTEGAVLGLEQTLKVEIGAGDKKKVLALSPVSGEPGGYKAVFIPTVQTTLTYRFFGTINGADVDLSFTCNPAGHPVVAEDTSEVKISDGVTRIGKSGAFGCPTAKADLGFPEPAATLNELSGGSSQNLGLAGLIFGVLGFIAGAMALMKSRKY